MRRIALAILAAVAAGSAAYGADAPKAPASRPVLSYDWSGTYSGLNLSSAWARPEAAMAAPSSFEDRIAFPASSFTLVTPGFNAASFGGGYQLGYNWLRGQWLVGVEANSAPAASLLGAGAGGSSIGAQFGVTGPSSSVTTVAPRVGYISDRFSIYGTGGVAVSRFDDSVGFTSGAAANAGNFGGGSGGQLGWTVGAGTEWVVVQNWTAKVEYSYVDLGRSNAALAAAPNADTSFTSRFTANIIRFGLNYNFLAK